VFHVRGGRVRGQRGWVVEKVEDVTTGDLVEQFCLQVYGAEAGEAIPREVLVPGLPTDADALAELLSEARGARVSLRVPQRGDKKSLMETVARNAKQAFMQHKLKRATDLTARSRALAEIQDALGLDEAPLRIECYDISHVSGTDVVGSMVVFEDGLARKSEYRRFAVRGHEGVDDTASMAEVLRRRFSRYLDSRAATGEVPEAAPEPETPGEVRTAIDPTTGRPRKFAYPPNLVVVDGGAPQVAAAARVLAELGIVDVALCGLAKRLEEVWLPGEDFPLVLPRTSEGLYLLQRVRDEAHRFAITYHRQKRSQRMTASELDDIPGLGEGRRKALLKHFGSLRKLRAATPAEITEVPGIGRRTADAIVIALHGQPQAGPEPEPAAPQPAAERPPGEAGTGPLATSGDTVQDRIEAR
jgi:excinuclease ABC subunit C